MRSIFRACSIALVFALAGCGPAGSHHLSVSAYRLGVAPAPDYERIQKRWTGTTEAACNYFVITSLCEAGDCPRDSSNLTAENFDTYLQAQGWRQVPLLELKILLSQDSDTDAILQRDGSPGHVSIPVGLSNGQIDGQIQVAQGQLGGVSNEITTVSDAYLSSHGFRVWVRP